eukprot:gene30064-35033_t
MSAPRPQASHLESVQACLLEALRHNLQEQRVSPVATGFSPPPGKPYVPVVLRWSVAELAAHSKPKNFKFSQPGLVSILSNKQLLQAALRQGRGPNFIIEQVSKAARGVHHAKGWKSDPDSIDLAFLVMKIGGPLLLTAVLERGQDSALLP